MDEEFVRSKLTDVHCAHCGKACSQSNISLVGHNGSFWIFSVFCESCRKYGFLSAIVKETGKPVELTGEEVEKLCIPVGSNDVLDMYTFLKDFEGDFSQLFLGKKSGG